MGNSYTEKDTGWDHFTSAFEIASGEDSVFVGYLRSSGNYKPKRDLKEGEAPKPITLAQLAAIHTYGSQDGTIPQRDFMGKALDDNKDKLTKLLKKLAVNARGCGR